MTPDAPEGAPRFFPRAKAPEDEGLEVRVYQGLTLGGGIFSTFGATYSMMTLVDASRGQPPTALAVSWVTLCFGALGALLTLWGGMRLKENLRESRVFTIFGAFLAPAAPAVGFLASFAVATPGSWFGVVFVPAAGGGLLGAGLVVLAYMGSGHLLRVRDRRTT